MVLGEKTIPVAEFLDEIQTKVFRVFFLAIYSHLYSFALRFHFLKLTQPLTLYTVKEKGGNQSINNVLMDMCMLTYRVFLPPTQHLTTTIYNL